eukprot:scaffold23885_cov86-Phaeocystis_antarctica.AAC.1
MTSRHGRERRQRDNRWQAACAPTLVAQLLPRLGTTYRRRCGRAARALHCRKPSGLRLHGPARRA